MKGVRMEPGLPKLAGDGMQCLQGLSFPMPRVCWAEESRKNGKLAPAEAPARGQGNLMGVGQGGGGWCLACPGLRHLLLGLSQARFLALASLLKGTPSWLELRSLKGKMGRTAWKAASGPRMVT